jgi:hypothetical protein
VLSGKFQWRVSGVATTLILPHVLPQIVVDTLNEKGNQLAGIGRDKLASAVSEMPCRYGIRFVSLGTRPAPNCAHERRSAELRGILRTDV